MSSNHICIRLAPLAALILGSSCAPAIGGMEGSPSAEPRRAILVSIDALQQERLQASLEPGMVPALERLWAEGRCATEAVPAFPSLTAASHAALWTGAWGDVSGIAANWQHRLPLANHPLTETVSGFSAEGLRAEPFWIAAGRQGVSVVGHHVTQGPQVPGYPRAPGDPDGWVENRRAEAAAALALPAVAVLNGYNVSVAPHRMITADSMALRSPTGWRGIEALDSGVEPREIAWSVGSDSVFALFHGPGEYDRITISDRRDAEGGATAVVAPVESAPIRGRELARHFSEALPIDTPEGRVYVRVRLFEVAPDLEHFAVYVPSLQPVDANRPDVAESYDQHVRGWVGNGAGWLLRNGLFGPPVDVGGDGTAEARYLETAELVTRQFMRGAEWGWREREPTLMLDYFPLGDEVDHAWLGFLDPRWPGYDPAVAEVLARARERAWQLVDLRLEQLQRFADRSPGTLLLVAGDHGFRSSWREFRPNALLRQAGILHLDGDGEIDLARTEAVSPNGYWISVNRVGRPGGTVEAERVAAVMDAVERALLDLVDEAGRRVITRVYRATDHTELGLGGIAGGDLYYETAEGIRWSRTARGEPLVTGGAGAGHGFPSTSPDMWTAFCASGDGIERGRFLRARLIDAAPTTAEWIGVEPPLDARGVSRLAELEQGRELP
jgi:hypothetical protein